jgi:hypothetical protein
MDNKGQASLEMAIFGALILAAIITLFSYAQKLNDQQYVAMDAFRSALKKANEASEYGGTASYSIIEHRRYIAGDFFRQGSRATVSDGSQVLWGKLPIDVVDRELDMGEFAQRIRRGINCQICVVARR